MNIIERGLKAKKTMIDNWGISLPDDFIPIDKCQCGMGLVWGVKNEDDKTRPLKNEYGQPIKLCGKCMIDISKKAQKYDIAKYSEKIKRMKEEEKAEREAKKNTFVKGSKY